MDSSSDKKKKKEKKKDTELYEENGFDPFLYQNVEEDKMDNIVDYLRWHREHPLCSTPRAPRRGIQSQIAAGTAFRCDEATEHAGKVYIQYGSLQSAEQLPDEFTVKPIGGEADFDEVSTIVKKYEEFLRYNEYDFDDFEDPWWNMSVKDQMTVSHIDDESVFEGMINDGSDIIRMRKERDARQIEQDKEFIAKGKENLEKLSLSKGWGQPKRRVKSAWKEDIKRTRFTENGKEGLKEYNIQARELRIAQALDDHKNDGDETVLGTVTGMSEAEIKDIKMIKNFTEELGGDSATDKLGEDFVKKAIYNRKYMDKGYSVFEGGLDFLDACTKVNAFKAIALLKLGAKPDTLTPEEEPVFVMMLRKIIVADAMKSATDDKNDKEREKCFKILDALAKHGADLEKWVGGEKALHIVAATGHVELTKWLIDHGAKVDSRSRNGGASPMMMAARFGHVEVISELVLREANLCMQDFSGRTALHYTALYGQTRCARFLLKIGANKRIKDKDLNTAAEVATSNGYAVTAQVIMGHATEFQRGKPIIDYLHSEMYTKKTKKEPKGVLGKIGNFMNSIFGTTTNEDGTVSKGCLSALADRISGWRDAYKEFEIRDMFRKNKGSNSMVFPDDTDNEATAETR